MIRYSWTFFNTINKTFVTWGIFTDKADVLFGQGVFCDFKAGCMLPAQTDITLK